MTVFVVQNAQRRSQHHGGTVPQYDLSPALQFGELAFLLPPGPVMLDPTPALQRLKIRLASYCDADYILCIGDPNAIAAASMVAAQMNSGRVKTLSWDRTRKCYTPVSLDLNCEVPHGY